MYPPHTHTRLVQTLESASSLSVFVAAEAVTQLLYAQDWTAGASTVTLELLKKLAKRHPAECARLLYGIDLSPHPLDATSSTLPLNLNARFYAVMVDSDPWQSGVAAEEGPGPSEGILMSASGFSASSMSGLVPGLSGTGAAASTQPQQGVLVTAGWRMVHSITDMSKATLALFGGSATSAVAPRINSVSADPGANLIAGGAGRRGGRAGGAPNSVARGRDSQSFPTRLDLLQACVFRSM